MTPEERDAIIKALNDDAHKLLSELEPNDPLVMRLKEELKLTNEHFYNLLNQMNRPKGIIGFTNLEIVWTHYVLNNLMIELAYYFVYLINIYICYPIINIS